MIEKRDISAATNSLIEKWALTTRKKIAQTTTSDVYLVEQTSGRLAVLKVLSKIGKEDEVKSSLILDWYDGIGSVQLIRSNDDAQLLEYAQGCELSELVYTDQDEQATGIACNVVRQLHRARTAKIPDGLITLRNRFSDLFTQADKTRDPIVRKAAHIADTLIRTTTSEIALHGDLHHHNIIRAERDWLAINPKGLIGDPAYDISNLFANPLNFADNNQRPERAAMIIRICSDELGYSKDRMARFAFVHNVIATIWSGTSKSQIEQSLHVARNLADHIQIPGTHQGSAV